MSDDGIHRIPWLLRAPLLRKENRNILENSFFLNNSQESKQWIESFIIIMVSFKKKKKLGVHAGD